MEAYQMLGDATVVELPAESGELRRSEGAASRLLDIVAASVMLIALTPLMIVVALAIVTGSPGPVLFRQRRLGRDMRPFTMLKFRTMRVDADSAPHREYTRQLILGAGGEPRNGLYKLAVDDRVTPVGRFLRGWSLDEIPQLFNVLLGHMSLVGPRPVLDYEAEHYDRCYWRRFAVKPGLTGLWQVSGRNERTYDEMLRFDVQYAERRTLGLDLVILIKTVWVVLRRKGVA